MMKWFKLYAGLQTHPKRYRFEGAAGTKYGLHFLTAWFSFVCTHAEDGNISKYGALEVERFCEWDGEPGRMYAALVSSGFIDTTKRGPIAHDWIEEHKRFADENAKRKGVKEDKKPKGYPRVTQGLPLVEEKRIEEKRSKPPKPDGLTGNRLIAIYCEEYKSHKGVGYNPSPRDAGQARNLAKMESMKDEDTWRAACRKYVTSGDPMVSSQGTTLLFMISHLNKWIDSTPKPCQHPLEALTYNEGTRNSDGSESWRCKCGIDVFLKAETARKIRGEG